MPMKLSRQQELDIFRKHAHKSSLEIGYEYGFEKHYKDGRAVRSAVYAVYHKVKNNPSKYHLDKGAVEVVRESMKQRGLSKGNPGPVQKEQDIDKSDIHSLVKGVRDTSFYLINKKLDKAARSKKQLEAISLSQLGTIAGIAFDKAQVLAGEATENIAMKAKISKDMSPDDLLDLTLKQREQAVSKNTGK